MPRIYIILLVLIFAFSMPLKAYDDEEDICIKRIVVNYDSLLYDDDTGEELKELYNLENKENNLLFKCYCKDPSARFSFFLEGNDDGWTGWMDDPLKEYTNLSPGRYRLFVRVSSSGRISDQYLISEFDIEPPFYLTTLFFIFYGVIVLLIMFIIYRLITYRHKVKQAKLESIIQERTEELMTEKEKTDSLLANLLPKDTADEIMLKGKATKQKYNFVTVLFSDIQGFTRIAEEVNPEILIDELDNFFFQFDSVVEKYNIEKIKTIGDAYMCAGGIPNRNRTNPIEVVLAALEMQEYMGRLKKEQMRRGLKFWDIRIGIHTGTVIAGVVGQKKLSYDIWGDTVNTASRMESSGIPGKINISGITYEYVKEFFICEYRGRMPVKYKGDLDMYFVKGIRPELRAEGKAEPNRVFIKRLLSLKIQDLEDHYFNWYEENVPGSFVFHNVRHIKNICTQAELLSTAEQVGDDKALIIRLAALFVKSGLLSDYNNPVEHSVSKLKEMAPRYGFNEDHISGAEVMIRNLFAGDKEKEEVKILEDAVYDYRGHVDYPEVVLKLMEEEKNMEVKFDSAKWLEAEQRKISDHSFNTKTANLLKSYSGKEQSEKLREHLKHI
ncbi:MAG: hypothetical protein K9J25_12960 [Bacteroidales bacterium]|nr:hypothetical protein [Bacteroidales bacterium]